MLNNRKKPTDHRQGTLVKLVDLMQRFAEIHHEEDFWVFDTKDRLDEGHMNQTYQDEIQDLMRELDLFDSTTIGNLYLTSGGRIVLDQGWGEYFDASDTVLFTLKELKSGMPANVFITKVAEKLKDMR